MWYQMNRSQKNLVSNEVVSNECGLKQARNQIGTPGGAKSFLRGAQIFGTMSNIFKLCPTHFTRGGENFSRRASPFLRNPWLRAWSQMNMVSNKRGLKWMVTNETSQMNWTQ